MTTTPSLIAALVAAPRRLRAVPADRHLECLGRVVLSGELGRGEGGRATDVGRILQKALAAAFQSEDELEAGASGSTSKLPRRPPPDRSRPARRCRAEASVAAQRRDQFGQGVGGGSGGAQVDGAFKGFGEQRREGLGVAVDRGGRAGLALRTVPACRLQRCGSGRGTRRGAGRRRRGRCWRRRGARRRRPAARGSAPRLVPPVSLSASSGRKRSAEQSEAW